MKNLLATTALSMLLGTSVAAQTSLTGDVSADVGGDLGVSTDGVTAETGADVMADVSADTDVTADGEMGSDEVMQTNAEMESFGRDGYTMATVDAATASQLKGAMVYDINDENVGEVGEIMTVGDAVSSVVIDFGGFLGMGEKQILMSMDDITVLSQDDGDEVRVYVSATEDELDAIAEYQS